MDAHSLGYGLIILAVIVGAGFVVDLYWWLIEKFARKFVREPLDRRAQRRAERTQEDQ